MQFAATAADYDAKPMLYFEQARAEMLPYIPSSVRRVLDVGCGSGSFGALLRRARGAVVWGIEPVAAAAAQAATQLDRAIHAPFDPDAPLPRDAFDCVVFNDVLEHLIDPAAALRLARELLRDRGTIVASIPNIRHFPTIWHLVVRGEWEYRDCGTLDKTHLRFFTRPSIAALFASAGFAVERLEGIHPYRGIPNVSRRVWRLFSAVNWVMGKRFAEMKYERFAVVAHRRAPVATA